MNCLSETMRLWPELKQARRNFFAWYDEMAYQKRPPHEMSLFFRMNWEMLARYPRWFTDERMFVGPCCLLVRQNPDGFYDRMAQVSRLALIEENMPDMETLANREKTNSFTEAVFKKIDALYTRVEDIPHFDPYFGTSAAKVFPYLPVYINDGKIYTRYAIGQICWSVYAGAGLRQPNGELV